MRVLFIVPSLKNAGPIIVVYDLVHLLIKRGYKCCVCYFDKSKKNLVLIVMSYRFR